MVQIPESGLPNLGEEESPYMAAVRSAIAGSPAAQRGFVGPSTPGQVQQADGESDYLAAVRMAVAGESPAAG